MVAVGMSFYNGENVIKVISVALGDVPDVRVQLVAAPEEGAIAEVGMEWTISYRDLMSGWNPVG